MSESSLSISLMRGACPNCHFVADSPNLSNPHILCPHCHQTGVRSVFPDPSQLDLLDMVSYFHRVADQRSDDLGARFVSAVRELTGHTYTQKHLAAASKAIQRTWERASRKHHDPEITELIEVTKKQLKLADDAVAEQMWPVIVQLIIQTHAVEEHKAVVIVTCTLLESLLDSLLEAIGSLSTTNSAEYAQLIEDIEKLPSFDRRMELFKVQVGKSFDAVLKGSAYPAYYDQWNRVREQRNAFVHGNPYAIALDIARMSYDLAVQAVPVFRGLHNSFAVVSQ